MCTRYLNRCKDLFGPPEVVEERDDPPPGIVQEFCGDCEGWDPCETFYVWDFVNNVRVRMCTKHYEGMLPVYGEPNDVELVTDPACDNFAGVLSSRSFIGSYCTRCEEEIKGESSPGIQADGPQGAITLCRQCFRWADEQILEGKQETTIEGHEASLTIPPSSWLLLRVNTHLRPSEVDREFNLGYKWNQKVMEYVISRLQRLTIGPD